MFCCVLFFLFFLFLVVFVCLFFVCFAFFVVFVSFVLIVLVLGFFCLVLFLFLVFVFAFFWFCFVSIVCLGFCSYVCLFSFLHPPFIWPCCVTFGVLVLQLGVKPEPLWWECRVLAAGLPENSWPQRILIRVSCPGGPHLDTKTWLLPTACKFQCWIPQAKQPLRQELSPTHQQAGCLKSY